MKSSKLFFSLALVSSILLHGAFFIPLNFDNDFKRLQALRSRMKIDRVVVSSEERTDLAEKSKTPARKKKIKPISRNSMKGKLEAKNHEYLSYVRQSIVEAKHYPYVAKKLNISAVYKLVITIMPSGEFSYEANSKKAHPVFNQAIDQLFAKIERFKAPPADESDRMVIELPLEFLGGE